MSLDPIDSNKRKHPNKFATKTYAPKTWISLNCQAKTAKEKGDCGER